MEQKELSEYLFEYLQLNVDETVLDIGSNDGIFLEPLKNPLSIKTNSAPFNVLIF